MRQNHRKSFLSLKLTLLVACVIAASAQAPFAAATCPPATQEALPAPPADRTLIYIIQAGNLLAPLAFEAGATPLNVEAVAKGDKRSYIELKGEKSATLINTGEPRFYLFLPDDPHAKPPFIVRLTEKRGSRRVSAMAQKGYAGFAIDSEEIVKPHYRVLGRENGMIFMEIRARELLMPGEYAIIGTDLRRVASFRVAAGNP